LSNETSEPAKRGLSKVEAALESEQESWGPSRVWLYNFLRNQKVDFLISGLIVFNLVLMIIEADQRAKCYPEDCEVPAIKLLNRVMLVVYTIEAGIRMYVDQLKYFKDRWNVLDFSIVGFAWFDEVMTVAFSSLPIGGIVPLLRTLRIARFMRAIRLLRFHPELCVMIRGFIGAMKAMFWGFVLILLLLLLWSLICVEIVHPINMNMIAEMKADGRGDEVNDFCVHAFSSVFNTSLLLFQTLVAGDSWGQCTWPVIKEQKLTFIIFAMALVSVSLGSFSLILAVIVDNAAAGRDGDREEQIQEKEGEVHEALMHWKEIIAQIDVDNSGTISWEELMEAYHNLPEVHHTLSMMGLSEHNLQGLFQLMDTDESGDLDYAEFMDTFITAQRQDLRTYLMMTKLQCDNTATCIKSLEADMREILGPRSRSASRAASRADSKEEKAQSKDRGTGWDGHNGALGPNLPLQVGLTVVEHADSPNLHLQVGLTAVEHAALASLDFDLKAMYTRLQTHFEALHQRVESNTQTLASQAQALEEGAVSVPGQMGPKLPEGDRARRFPGDGARRFPGRRATEGDMRRRFPGDGDWPRTPSSRAPRLPEGATRSSLPGDGPRCSGASPAGRDPDRVSI